MRLFWNDAWRFTEHFSEDMIDPNYDDAHFSNIRVPHTVVETPFNYFSENLYQMVSCYRRRFFAPVEWQGKAVLLTFEGVAHEASVYVNGHACVHHKGGYTAFTADVSSYMKYGEENIVTVKVDSRESLNIPPFGYVVDYMTYGGIYRDVYVDVKPKTHLKDVFVYSEDVLKASRKMIVQTTLSEAIDTQKLKLTYCLRDAQGRQVLTAEKTLENVASNAVINAVDVHEIPLPDVQLWDVDSPYLYTLEVSLVDGDVQDTQRIRMGFREAIFDKEGFKLNGKPLKLRGLNRHQSYPYVGYAMPKRPQQLDATIMKHELGLNAVRTSHYPQSKHFIEACDAMGLLVFTEMPGWQHIGDASWQEIALSHVSEMVLQYRNHPSVVLWGVRINESKDDDAFYTKTNQMAHALDPSRQTGGVRCIKNSHLLEDVYTFNDFSFNGKTKGIDRKKDVTSKVEQSYLVTEYNGHMFPTKSFDSEAHRTEHALRHAVVLNDILGEAEVAGGFGWCLFDYNTHQDFGSGDRICYHGVLDPYRNHKLAAAVYSSQGSTEPVLKMSSDMAIGDFPEGGIGKVYAFSNAEQVKLYKNGVYVKTFEPNREAFPHLPHAPFIIDDFIGELMEKNEGFSRQKSEDIKAVLMAVSIYGQTSLPLRFKLKVLKLMLFGGMTFNRAEKLFYDYVGNWGGKATEYRLDAIQKDAVVKSIYKQPMQSFVLRVDVDATDLIESSTYDVATLRISAVSEHGELLTYFSEAVEIIAEGAIEVIGPHHVSMRGGCCGTYVKTVGQAGKGVLKLKCRGEEEKIEFNIKF